MSEYWFISYNASGYDRGRGLQANTVEAKSPAEFVLDTVLNERINDGPYIILYAERITEDQYKRMRDHIG